MLVLYLYITIFIDIFIYYIVLVLLLLYMRNFRCVIMAIYIEDIERLCEDIYFIFEWLQY